MEQQRYKITNITIAPEKKDAQGNDLRRPSEKVGHPIQFRDELERPITVYPRKSVFVTKLDGGILGLQRGGYIKIEKVVDITEELTNHTYKAPVIHKGARAVEMGKDDYKQNSGAELEGAVNPDGDPNFLVKAGEYVPKSRSNTENGESEEVSETLS